MRTFFFFLFIALIGSLPGIVAAQPVSASLGINGLTCSLCSFGVQQQLQLLPFVEKTSLDLNTHIAEVSFKKGQAVNMKDLVDAVYKAGFSVGYTKADFLFDSLALTSEQKVLIEGVTYVFIKPSKTTLQGKTTLTFIDKKFLSIKSYNFWKPLIKEQDKQEKNEPPFLYHVTL